jgi:NADH dehydrogenase [ubiquinone] 1 alpha subcomplex assembly factor 5
MLRRAGLGLRPRLARHASIVFDRSLKVQQRERAARSAIFSDYTYLHDEIAERLVERLEDIHESYEFGDAVDLCCGSGSVRRALAGRGVARLLECDGSAAMLAASAARREAAAAAGDEEEPPLAVTQLQLDDENPRLEKESADLVISSMNLHWVNDLPSTLATVRRTLRPNGLFLGAMLGGETLREMRSAFVLADLERRGGVAQRMSPLCSVADAGALLQAAGFALPAVDTETVTIHYPDAWTLFHHLRAMGEQHATAQRTAADRSTLLAAASIYQELYGQDTEHGLAIPATFQLIYMTGWSPHESQQRPSSRGSAQVSLKDLNLPGVGAEVWNSDGTPAGDPPKR